jgi:hypothetical protein
MRAAENFLDRAFGWHPLHHEQQSQPLTAHVDGATKAKAAEFGQKAQQAGDQALAGAKDAAHAAGSKAAEFGQKAQQAGDQALAGAKEAAHAAGSKAAEFGQKAQQAGDQALAGAKEATHAAGSKAAEFGQTAPPAAADVPINFTSPAIAAAIRSAQQRAAAERRLAAIGGATTVVPPSSASPAGPSAALTTPARQTPASSSPVIEVTDSYVISDSESPQQRTAETRDTSASDDDSAVRREMSPRAAVRAAETLIGALASTKEAAAVRVHSLGTTVHDVLTDVRDTAAAYTDAFVRGLKSGTSMAAAAAPALGMSPPEDASSSDEVNLAADAGVSHRPQFPARAAADFAPQEAAVRSFTSSQNPAAQSRLETQARSPIRDDNQSPISDNNPLAAVRRLAKRAGSKLAAAKESINAAVADTIDSSETIRNVANKKAHSPRRDEVQLQPHRGRSPVDDDDAAAAATATSPPVSPTLLRASAGAGAATRRPAQPTARSGAADEGDVDYMAGGFHDLAQTATEIVDSASQMAAKCVAAGQGAVEAVSTLWEEAAEEAMHVGELSPAGQTPPPSEQRTQLEQRQRQRHQQQPRGEPLSSPGDVAAAARTAAFPTAVRGSAAAAAVRPRRARGGGLLARARNLFASAAATTTEELRLDLEWLHDELEDVVANVRSNATGATARVAVFLSRFADLIARVNDFDPQRYVEAELGEAGDDVARQAAAATGATANITSIRDAVVRAGETLTVLGRLLARIDGLDPEMLADEERGGVAPRQSPRDRDPTPVPAAEDAAAVSDRRQVFNELVSHSPVM